MTEFAEVVRARRMTRAFDDRSISPGVLDGLVDLAARSPSAGKTQGWHLVVLEGDVMTDGTRRIMSTVGFVNQRYLVTLVGNRHLREGLPLARQPGHSHLIGQHLNRRCQIQ